jgi:hypothetical protein
MHGIVVWEKIGKAAKGINGGADEMKAPNSGMKASATRGLRCSGTDM